MRTFLLVTALLLAPSTAAAQAPTVEAPTDLFLAGGALALCSDLQPRACRDGFEPVADARRASNFVFDDAGVARALDPLLWGDAREVDLQAVRALLHEAARRSAGQALGANAADELLENVCLRKGSVVQCADNGDGNGDTHARPWRALVDAEQAAVLAAMEVPQVSEGRRAIERAHPLASANDGGVEVVRAFVEAARARADGQRPRIAVVTASALDPFDPVDFYLGLFEATGADARWWPIDAALNAAVHGDDCDALDAQRLRQLQLPGRERVYPDLAREQRDACEAPDSLASLPAQVDGIFFAGGDQWRLRRALVDADDRPNVWLRALRQAHADGVVVGGTSAGAAVQSGAAMVSNGSTAEGLRSGARAVAPPQPGCERAGRCPASLSGDALTWWPAGGTGLAADGVVDTHFSERARELRLLLLMQASDAALGFGADETSALRVRQFQGHRELQAYGAHGGWVFERVHAEPSGALQARVHYLAPGERVRLDDSGLSAATTLPMRLPKPKSKPLEPPRDALEDGALRAAAAWLSTGQADSLQLAAGNGRVTLSRTPQTRAWPHAAAEPGVLHLLLLYEPGRGDAPDSAPR